MLTIRPFNYSDEDYRLALDINAAVFDDPPDPMSEWKHDDANWNPDYPYYRDMVLRGDTVVAFFETFQSPFAYHPKKFGCRIYVDPQHEAADIRPFVLQYTLDRLADRDLIALTSGMLDSIPEALRFFEEYGFEPVAEEKLSKLDVTTFDPAAFAGLLAKMTAEGIDIVRLTDLQASDPDWQRKLYDLDVTVNRDIPATGEKHYPEFEKWLESRLSGPKYDPEAWFVAVDAGRYVGQSHGNINREGEPAQFITGVTAVRREYRRRGIATALKVYITEHVKAQGVPEIFTTNDSKNPMYQLNLALGFTPQPSWLRVEKKLP